MATEQQAADAPDTTPVSDEALLKAKKEEAKAAKEAEKASKKAEKEARVHTAHHGKGKVAVQQRRNPLKAHGKKYRAAAEKIDKNKLYLLDEAIALVKATATTKFDATVEIHTRLVVDPRKSDQQVRSTVVLPHGTGKKLRVVAFVGADQVAKAKAAGAVEAGDDDLIEKVSKGWLDFDVAVATPELMKKLAKIARALGQAGKMPNPKAGTVSEDFVAMIEEINKGKVEFRNDKTGILHNVFGKASFDEGKLRDNLATYLRAVQDAKPKGVKGAYIASIYLTTSMGPSIKLDGNEVMKTV